MRTRSPLLVCSTLAWLAAWASLTVGCDDGGSGDGGTVEADAGVFVITFDAGPLPDPSDGGTPDAGPANTVVFVTGVTPPNGPLSGGNRVVFEGESFDPTCVVRIGGVEATRCLFLTTRSMSCEIPPGEQAGPADVEAVCALGVGLYEGGYTYFSPVHLDSVEPATGTTEGGTDVVLRGEAFSASMVALIGDRHVVGLSVSEDGATATMKTPPGLRPGRVDVVVIDAFGRSVLPLAFTYTGRLALDAVSPPIVQAGQVIELVGSGFSDRDGVVTTASVGPALAARDNLVSDRRVRASVPELVPGPYDVSVQHGSTTVTLARAVVVMGEPVGSEAVTGVVPSAVDVDGAVVTIVGEGFLAGVGAVTIGGVAATDVSVLDDRRLQARAPARPVGSADVTVTFQATGDVTLPGGLSYVEEIRIDSVSPGSTSATTGGTITVTGSGFTAGVDVFVGGIACTDVVVTSPQSLTCVIAAGAAGPADVRVVGADGSSSRLGEAVVFETAPRVLGIRPARGAYTGDVVVSVVGTGFSRLERLQTATARLIVLIGGAPCDPRETRIVSDNLIVTRSPLTDTGVLDVTVALATITVPPDGGAPTLTLSETEQATAPRVFTAFDPMSILGGTRGGPIDGALYVTVLDAVTGFPIPNALAFTGTNGVPTAADITHFPFGQATLSGPDIVGAQTVTVAADGYETSSLIDVNAAEVTLYLLPIAGGGGGGGGTPPPPPPPAQLRGRVFGFAKEFFDPAALGPDEIAIALVVTTARDEFSGTPNPGSDNVVFEEGGEFFLANARPGRIALVALAGIFNLTTSEFRPKQMGVRREVFSERGVTRVDQDIELTIPLDQDIQLSLPDAPLDFDIVDVLAPFGNGPDVTRVVPFIQFGGEGAFNFTVAIDGDRNHALEGMPKVPGELLTFIAGAYSTTGRNLFTADGTASLTSNSVIVTGQGTAWGISDPFSGEPLAIGQIFVTTLPDGSRFASDILGVTNDNSIRLRDRAPISATNLGYHIGRAGVPSSEVVQDGVGNLRGGVTIQPVLGIPEPITPVHNGVLENRTLRWRPQPGQQPTIHLMYVYEPFDFRQLWSFYVEGSRTKVPVPVVPDVADFLPVLPVAERDLPEDFVPPQDLLVGGFFWQHEAIFVPDLRYDNWSNLNLSTRGRRAWTTNVSSFVRGQDN
jgi:hypothetical protein